MRSQKMLSQKKPCLHANETGARSTTTAQFQWSRRRKMNVVKMVHQKRSNKHGQTIDELKTRKRMEVLTEAKKKPQYCK